MVKRLYRNRHNRVIAGVCSGLADYTGLEIALIRLIFIVLAFFDGMGFYLYLIMMIIVPKQPKSSDTGSNDYVTYGKDATDSKSEKTPPVIPEPNLVEAQTSQASFVATAPVSNALAAGDNTLSFMDDQIAAVGPRTYWIGLILVALGMYFFVLPFLPVLKFEYLFAFALIGLGFYLAFRKS